ncbi:MAG: UDP-N-acetylmuramoyl-tripeptide--D-alanyl-D-alanine ligase [Holosporales bacterium]|jgi:UDP-N-acetylmuramoyl-tripeptide--D-alanyl-D-alanine ligase|nr:UDP-N-acetylmuramoyl-tripeptide--D-alanyl-D-alanine ligase [Holosporales bacterium]
MTPPLFSAQELQQVFNVPIAQDVFAVAIDSRFVKPGTLFFALRGDHRDGHEFIERAIAAGATLVIAEHPAKGAVVVKDPYAALLDLARYARERYQGAVIGITGSVGKTGTREALKTVLKSTGLVHSSEKSFNNRWGVPLTLANLPQDAAYSLIEMGTNHFGEIRDLSMLVRSNGVVITSIGAGHTAFLDSLSGVAHAKMEIFDGLEPNGWAVFPSDSPYAQMMQERAHSHDAQIFMFGTHPSAMVRLCHWDLNARSSRIEVQINGQSYLYTVPIPGEHWVLNSTCLLAVASALGLSLEEIYQQMQNILPLDGRGTIHRTCLSGKREVCLLDEAFNANPTSMRAAIMLLGLQVPENGARTIAVLGDMGELGDASLQYHQDLAATLGKNVINRVFCCGPMMKNLYDILPEERRGTWSENSQELCLPLEEELKAGDVVLIKGSHSMHMEYILRFLKERT